VLAQQPGDRPPRPEALARLASLDGDWQGTAALRATQWTPGSTSKLDATFRWILSGQHLEGTLRYTVAEKPFESRMLMSYDSHAKLYRVHWLDNASSESITFSGKFSDKGILDLSATRRQDSQVVTERLRLTLMPSGGWEMTSSSNATGEMIELAKLSAHRKE
jgi:hypothetical protein